MWSGWQHGSVAVAAACPGQTPIRSKVGRMKGREGEEEEEKEEEEGGLNLVFLQPPPRGLVSRVAGAREGPGGGKKGQWVPSDTAKLGFRARTYLVLSAITQDESSLLPNRSRG